MPTFPYYFRLDFCQKICFLLWVPSRGRRRSKKVGSVTFGHTKTKPRSCTGYGSKRAVKIIKFVTVTVGPLFCKFGNRKSYQIRDLGPWFWQNTGTVLSILDYQYKRNINLDQNCRLYQHDTKKMSLMISNCLLEKPNINLKLRYYTGGVFSAVFKVRAK